MKKFDVSQLKEGLIIYHKKGWEDALQYSGWNNGKIWDFYSLVFDDENLEGYFSKEKIVRLTKSELNDYYIAD